MPKLADTLWALWPPPQPPVRGTSFFLMEKGYFDDMTELNVEGQELMKPKLRPGGAATSEACQKQDRRLDVAVAARFAWPRPAFGAPRAVGPRPGAVAQAVRSKAVPESYMITGCCMPWLRITTADIDGENPFQVTLLGICDTS